MDIKYPSPSHLNPPPGPTAWSVRVRLHANMPPSNLKISNFFFLFLLFRFFWYLYSQIYIYIYIGGKGICTDIPEFSSKDQRSVSSETDYSWSRGGPFQPEHVLRECRRQGRIPSVAVRRSCLRWQALALLRLSSTSTSSTLM